MTFIDIYFGWAWEYLATKRLCIYEPYLRAAFETVFKKELQDESSLNICEVVELQSWPFCDLFSFFFHALVCSFFQGYLHNLRSVVCSAQNISQLVEKKKR